MFDTFALLVCQCEMAMLAMLSSALTFEIFLCRSGVNGDLISWFASPGVSSACQERIAELLQVTGAYSISGNA